MKNKRLAILLLLLLILSVVCVFVYPKPFEQKSNTQTNTEDETVVTEEMPYPLEDQVLGISTFHELTSGGGTTGQPKGTVKIPVLMYHNIGPVPSRGSSSYRGLFVSPSMFDQQMAYLKSHHYKSLTPSEFYDILKSGKNPTRKVVMITFDDGSRGQYKYAYPTLKKYGLTGVFYIISGRSPINMTEVKKMAKNGMIIDSHTVFHEDLKRVKATKQLKYELVSSKKALESVTKQKIVSIAYPGCVADSRSFKIIKENGYKLGFSCGSTVYHKYSNRFYLSRVHIFSNMYSFQRALKVGL